MIFEKKIWSIDSSLTGATIPVSSGPESNSYEE